MTLSRILITEQTGLVMLDSIGVSQPRSDAVRRPVLPSWCLHSWLVMNGRLSEYYSSIGNWVGFQDLVWFGRRI